MSIFLGLDQQWRAILIGAVAAILLGVTVTTGSYLGIQTERRLQEISRDWTLYTSTADHSKSAWLSDIRGHLGYGGVIHNFKNYVLRRDAADLERLKKHVKVVHSVLDKYENADVTTEELQALRDIRATVKLYESKIPIAAQAAKEGWSAERTDSLVRVGDTKAVSALQQLERHWREQHLGGTRDVITAVKEGEELISIGLRYLVGLAVVALALYVLFYVLVWELRQTIGRLSDQLTRRKRAEQSEKKFLRAVEQSPATIIITDTEGRIEYVNRRFEELTGYMRQEMLGKTPRMLQSGDMPSQDYTRMRAQLARGEDWRGVFRNRKKGGGFYWAETVILPLKDEDGTVGNFIGIGEDITEKKRARDQIAKAQKMEAVGLLAGGIAHDFNNILSAIIGNLFLARQDAPRNGSLDEELEQIEIATKRAQSLVQQLLTFARRQPTEARHLDLGDAVDEVLRLVRVSIPPSIEIEFDKGGEAIAVLADPTHLHQVVMNLCRNAAEAIGLDTGKVSISLSKMDRIPESIGWRSAEGIGDWACITVRDDGPGMSPEVAEKVFDAFFTTKPLGKGTGLGLSVVTTLVEDMGGLVSLDTDKGEGAEFSIMLPVASAPDDKPSVRKEIMGGRERILFVDDELEIVTTYRRLLIRLGYMVEAYTEPKAALEAFRADPDRYQLVITDLVMPNLNGEALADEIRQLRPLCPVMIFTAYKTRALDRRTHKQVRVIKKPLDLVAFSQSIRELIDARSEQQASPVS